MDKETSRAPELVWQRLNEPMDTWVVFVPVLFALGVIALLFMYRKEGRGTFLIVAGSFFAVFAAVYLPLAFLLKDSFSWVVVVVPILAVALVYVGLMYVKDARAIHPAWAGFLGFLRCTVYGILTVVFLLPGCQSFETTRTQSRIILAFDVSRSMDAQDRLPEPGAKDFKAPTRKQEVMQMLQKPIRLADGSATTPLKLIMNKTEVTLYRFGGRLDDKAVLHFKNYDELLQAEKDGKFKWENWLNPDPLEVKVAEVVRKPGTSDEDHAKAVDKAEKEALARRGELLQLLNGTNVYGALDRISKLESGNYVQAIVVFSDGHSNSGLGEESLGEFFARVDKPSPPINVFTVGVGEDRLKVKIEIQDLLVPTELRPDDKFPIRVNLTAEGLPDVETELDIELTRIKDKDNRPAKGTIYRLDKKKGKFKGGGDFPRVTFEHPEIDLKKLTGTTGSDEAALEPIMGVWTITARVPKHPKEHFAEKEHVQTAEFQVFGKQLRVLLLSSGPVRDYQFLRTLFYREALKKRLEFCVYLQNAVGTDNIDQDVEAARFLTKFPDRLGKPTKEDPFGTLSAFDVVIGFDPDWTALAPDQLKLLKRWVGAEGGGLIFVAGPINAYQLSLKDGDDAKGIKSLRSICPVIVQDNRLFGVLEKGLDTSRPHRVNFEKEAADYDFLRLDDEEPGPTAGWDEFFYGKDGKDAKDALKRGFYWYYPVEEVNIAAKIIGTFEGPPEARIRVRSPGDEKGRLIDPPFFATMKVGGGKTAYIGSAETWRLRQAKEIFHDRFWVKLARYCSSGLTQEKRYGRILANTKALVGKMFLEAEVKGDDMLPLKTPSVKAELHRIDKFGDVRPVGFELKAKDLRRPDLAGWYDGNVELPAEGEYEIRIPITKTEAIKHTVWVKEPNTEKDHVRTNFPTLVKVSGDLTNVLNGLEGEVYARVKNRFEGSAGSVKGSAGEKLFLPLSQADILPDAIRNVPPRPATVKGKVEPFWAPADGKEPKGHHGLRTGLTVNAAWLAILLPLGVGLLGFAILSFIGQILNGVLFASGFSLLSLIMLIVWLSVDLQWPDLDVDISFILVTLVGLLGIEWLTRKLLKLA